MLRSVKTLIGVLLFSAIPGVAIAAPQELDARDAELVSELTREANTKPIAVDKGAAGQVSERVHRGYPGRKGVILVTPDAFLGLIPTGHAAIVYDSNYVVESVSRGVIWGRNDWYRAKDQAYGVTVRSTTSLQDSEAAEWARMQIGKPYNFNYFNRDTRSRFYCSQLVWAAFKDNFGIDLDTWRWSRAIHPMELVQTDKVALLWRKA